MVPRCHGGATPHREKGRRERKLAVQIMWLSGRRFFLSLTILAASVCLALGITLPILKLTSFGFWTTEHSLLSTVGVLLKDNQTFLGLIVLVFSILLPITKLLYLLLVSTLPPAEILRHQSRLRALEWLGKWSMHDVLVLALTIFFIKSQEVYDASSLNGVYFFTAAVVLMILAYAWIRTDGMAAAPELVPVLPQPDLGRKPMSSGWRNFALSFLIILALGLILPTIRFTTVYVWTNEHSILTIMYALFENNEYFLCAVVFAVSVFFPFLKLFYLLTLITSHDMPQDFRRKSFATMEWIGRYSMTDVMVLALMIFYVNSSGYTEARVLPGVYFFAASAMMTMLAYAWANAETGARRSRRGRQSSGGGPAIAPHPGVSIAPAPKPSRRSAA
jgi:paraquat-inducible protein A